ncbi:MAG: hypothetical protein KKH12_11345 [Gammaproteobacteria bacterium]|nr:hypothetical protein [Gammaproteobacteria bacterium]MBU1482253.1 hypothetical protein [Gammaproteobacteria bacterium]
MSKLYLCAIALLATLSINGYCEDAPAAEKRFGQGGGRPSEAQIAEWRAKREAREGQAATADAPSPAGSGAHGDMSAMSGMTGMAGMPGMKDEGSLRSGRSGGKPSMKGMPEGAARSGGRPSGMGMRSGGALWLSDTPPMRGDGARGGRSGMAGMDMSGGGWGKPAVKRLWLRAGNDPQRSGFAQEDADAQVETLLVTPDGKPEGEPLPSASDDRKGLSFEMPVQGFYRLYLTSRKLQGDILNVNVAKAEVANFGHGGDVEEAARGLQATRYSESAPLEIVRERKPDERKFFQLKSGEDQVFIVLKKGLPLQGARVRMVSYQGWSKEEVSDEQGRVSFQIVRDYFPPWNEFEKRFKATYLLIAEANAAETGKYQDKPYTSVRYQASLSGNYYPSPTDYLSYAWALGVGMAILLFCGVAVYLYRRRRVKPYQEERFHEGK